MPVAELQSRLGPAPANDAAKAKSERRIPVRSILAEVDRNEIVRALKEADGRIGGSGGAAARLGLKRTTFITRMKKFGIHRDQMSEHEMDSADASDTSDASMIQNAPLGLTSSE